MNTSKSGIRKLYFPPAVRLFKVCSIIARRSHVVSICYKTMNWDHDVELMGGKYGVLVTGIIGIRINKNEVLH